MRASVDTIGESTAQDAQPGQDVRDLLPFQLSRVATLFDRSGHAHLVSRYGITISEWRVLALIAATAPTSFSHVAQLALIDKGQLSRTIARLAELGWVVSERTRENKRNVELRLTPEGQRQYRRILAFIADLNARILARFSDAERLALFAMLDRLKAYVETSLTELAAPPSRRQAGRATAKQAGKPSMTGKR